MSARKVVWALFDSETSCCQEALKDFAEVYSFGIGSGNKHIELDLGDFETAKKVLDKYPKPDYIFASPPCESWVSITKVNIKKFTKEHGYNLFWQTKWVPFDFREKHKKTRENGCDTAQTTALLIKHYRPEFWAIENGSTSWIFDYMFDLFILKGYKNRCTYFSYGFNILKPTIIYSNAFLQLQNIRPNYLLPDTLDTSTGKLRETKKKFGLLSCTKNYGDRSKVPALLYQDIYRQFKHGGQKTLFKEAI